MKFWYEDHNDGLKKVIECNVLEFIGKVTKYIAPKGFRMVRRYGVYSRINNKLAKDIVHLYNFVKQRNIDELLKEKNKQNEVKKSWKQRIIYLMSCISEDYTKKMETILLDTHSLFCVWRKIK